jgi:antitoxin component of RelBE/YafQ-DinJ toxin-antitoxin module
MGLHILSPVIAIWILEEIMSIASTAAKRRWNKAHYAEIKASLKKGLVMRFKAKCKENGASIASVLAMQMSEYCGTALEPKVRKNSLPHDTRPKRRKSVAAIAGQLDDILQNETNYRENFPNNLACSIRAEAADSSIEKLGEALCLILEAY